MRFLKVFRWFVFGFMLMFAVTAGFFALYYVPGGMFNQIIEEYLTNANLELQTTLYTYAGLAGVCLFFFILFSIIVKASKRRRERESYYSSSSTTSNSYFVSTMSGSKTFAELPADKEIYWDSSESNLYADLVEGDFLIIRKGKLSLECGVNTASYGATNDDASDIYPKITFFPYPGRPNGFLLVVSERELNLKEGDVARIWAIRDRIKKQVDSDISHIRPLEGGIPFVCYVEGITNTLMNASVKDTFIDAREHGYFSNFENHLLSVMSSDIEREYLRDIFNVIHRNNRNY